MIYSLSFADDQIVLAQDHDDVEYMARKLRKNIKNGTHYKFKKN